MGPLRRGRLFLGVIFGILGVGLVVWDALSPGFDTYLQHHVAIAALATSAVVVGVTALLFERLAAQRRLKPLVTSAIDAIGQESATTLHALSIVLEELELGRDPTAARQAFDKSRQRLEGHDQGRGLVQVDDDARALYADLDVVRAEFRFWVDEGAALAPGGPAPRRAALRHELAEWHRRLDPWTEIAERTRQAALDRRTAEADASVAQAMRGLKHSGRRRERAERALARKNARLEDQLAASAAPANEPASAEGNEESEREG
jgi:hypothetical protein